jgi:hypothetical protein
MSQFHRRTFELLSIEAAASTAAIASLRRVESRIRKRLPVSLIEWYLQRNACAILMEHSNTDPPVALDDLGKPLTDPTVRRPRELANEGLLPIRFQNQGVCTWAVRLDGSEDPPVVVTYDERLCEWIRCADHFSDYVFTCVWDYVFVLRGEILIQAQNDPIRDDALIELRKNFKAITTTFGWPGHTQYRFERGNWHLLIWASDEQADWFLTAMDSAAITDAMTFVWNIDNVGKSFWSNDEEGEQLVKGLRETR